MSLPGQRVPHDLSLEYRYYQYVKLPPALALPPAAPIRVVTYGPFCLVS
jgi:hypothetical protein